MVATVMLIPAAVEGQTYSSLWSQVKTAENKDLPQTQLDLLRQIEHKAAGEKAYGQLLKAGLKRMEVTAGISPDSLKPAVDEMVRQERTAGNAIVKAVYNAVLYHLYAEDNDRILGGTDSTAAYYRRKAMAEPAKLAAAAASDFEPLTVKGYNASVFGGDMLSVVGYEVGDFETMWQWYKKKGMRQAACMSALELLRQHRPSKSTGLKKSEYIQSLDSITHVYAELDIACEAAIERYEYMSQCHDVTVEDKIRYIHYALDKWGGWQGASRLRNAEKELTAPYMRAEMEHKVTQPGIGQILRFRELRNIEEVTVNVYRVAINGDTELGALTAATVRNLRPKMTELPELRRTRTYMGQPAYQVFDDSVDIAALPVGVYMVEVQTSPATETMRELYFVSDVYCMSLPMPDNRIRYVVVSATTGQPLAGAKISVRENRNKTAAGAVTLTCDANGENVYKYSGSRPRYVYAYTENDKACPAGWNYGSFSYYGNRRSTERTSVFTDRKLYRPGQTVHVAAVVYANDSITENHAVAGKKVKAVLRDPNYKVVEEKELTTDRYGSCSAQFVLPADRLNGHFTVVVNNSVTGIRVEEYKRPTFHVEFPKINEKYQNGDTLMVKSKALTYAGVPVQGAKVKYRVERTPALWWRCGYSSGKMGLHAECVASDEATTSGDGSFVVSVPMVLPDNIGPRPMFYNFTVEADVTDIGGETQSGTVSIPLGSRTTAFSCDLPEKVLGDNLKTITFSLHNAAGMEISADVHFSIDGADTVSAHTGQPVELAKTLESGLHRLSATCENDTLQQEFVVFCINDTIPCTETPDWFYVSAEAFPADGGPVTVQVGSSDENVHIAYSIISGKKVLESGTADKSNALVNRKFTYKEEYGEGLLLNFAWVKNGRCYSHLATIRRPQPDRKLYMKWTTFRDRVKPGQAEEWKLNVTKPDGKPADALLIATMYDKSLDRIAAHDWSFNPAVNISLPHSNWCGQEWGGIWFTGMQQWKYLTYKDFAPSRIDPALLYFIGTHTYVTSGMAVNGRSVKMAMTAQTAHKFEEAPNAEEKVMVRGIGAMAVSDAKSSDEAVFDTMESALTDAGETGTAADGNVQMRENLNETAFFYPDVQTDADGNVTLHFTFPESLTTWRFMGMAHTTDMLSGMLEGETVAKRDVMIQPNMPRFVRMGDRAQVTARIFNTGEGTAAGTAKMELIDPETEQTVFVQEHAFEVKPDETGYVTFDYSPDGRHTLLICRITASGKSFGDGEQHYLPILPDRERITVTVPFTQPEPGTRTIDLSKMFPAKSDNGKLTVEYTNNPAWLMVQALPSVGTPRDENAIEQAAAIYANVIADHIIKQNPKIKTAFVRWKMERGEEASSLKSGLERNSELKDIVLSETPWVTDADRETEQKQRLADFFDESSLQHRISSAVENLKKLQRQDGSWSWWPGMDGSMSITVEVAQMLVRMNAMTGRQTATGTMLDNAFSYMGKEIVKEVNNMRKEEKRGAKQVFPGETALRYLYLSIMDGRKQSAGVQSACEYLITLLKKDIKQQSIYDKALTAIILAGHGETVRSREYVKSLKEYTVYTDEAGRYYDTRRAAYSWCDYRIPTEVAAIEAIMKVTPEDRQTVDEMRRWLLHEKRTQAWETPINSVNAVYSFLYGNDAVLASREQSVLAIDGKPLEIPESTASIGYVRTSVPAPSGNTFTATKTSEGTSWGALYAQFMQKTSDVTAQGSGISIKREVLVKDEHSQKNVLLSPDTPLSVGARITVRITIEAKHDLDFVQVTDRRAACMEPVELLSGYRNGAYCSPKDNATNYYFDRMTKGRHVIETVYYVDRIGTYETGTCSAGCAYAPEYRATATSRTITVK